MKTQSIKLALSLFCIIFLITASAKGQSWSSGTESLYVNPSSTKVAIGTTVPRTPLYIANGDFATGFTKPQIGFGWNGNNTYSHWIHTRHDAGTNRHNAIDFYLWRQGQSSTALGDKLMMSITGTGVGIGIALPTAELEVNGKIVAEEIEVKNVGADYVFADNYILKPLPEVELFIRENGHLPGIPPAKETEKGVNLGEFNTLLLEKIEELTLYTIQLQKEIEILKSNLK